MKKLTVIVLAIIAIFTFIGCAQPEEPTPNIPVGKPGDGGPQPSKVGAAEGGQPAPTGAAEGGVSTPGTE
ncbi:MAG: hypothetical protein ACKVQS_11915 [Fimbriimonadaceae bacterium]